MTNEIIEMRAIVKGRVQGVGFRATTIEIARQLNIKGLVRNLPDGNVEIIAQESKEKLDQLVDLLKKEKLPIKIDSISVNFSTPKQQYDRFTIN